MPEVFPVLGMIGSAASHSYQAKLRMYANGDYRRYKLSSHNHRSHNLVLKDISKVVKDAATAFFNARMTATTDEDFEFVFYSMEETSSVDAPGGVELTGQYTAIFAETGQDETTLEWTRTGKCRWSASIPIILLRANS